MKVSCHREGLLAAVQLAAAAIPSRDLKPVLANIKMSAAGDNCILLATDLELGIRLEVRGVQVDEPGDALLPASRLQAILREAPDEIMSIETDTQTCMVRGGTNEFEMGGEDPAEFPDVPSFSDEKYHEMAAGGLREMIRRTLFATAAENPRYALTGVLWELEEKLVRLVATDGRRLAVTEGEGQGFGGHETKGQTHVVPTKAMQLLERNLTDPNEVVRISLRSNEALFRTDRATLYSRLVEGRFPPYREVFPKKPTVRIPLVVGPFHAAVRQAAIMTDSETKKVIFSFGKKKLTMQARGAKTGRSKVDLLIDYDGKTIEVAFDPKFVSEMLRVLNPDDQLTVDLTDADSVALFRYGEKYSYIVMPLS
ncbi:MAG TPA: DNA polymerase III subunit beta [Gemmataceae bacterium]|jgi:DNA polymerase-3 subunit beta|nr:DNA polymerase III subunit beta [Gemmataceae bacterium]